MSRLPCLSLILVCACSPPSSGNGDGGNGGDAGVPADAGPRPDASPPASCQKTFRLDGYAGASQVLLTGDFTSPTPWAGDPSGGAVVMERQINSWVTTLDLDAGQYRYKFVIDGTTWVHDTSNPWTEDDGFGDVNSVYQCGAVQGVCGDPDTFDWRDAVMYFVMTDRFFDSDNSSDPVSGASGMDAWGSSGQYEGGDLAGVRAKIPYLADLGVTAIWLSAPYENRNSAGAALDPADSHQYSGYHGYWPSPANIDYSNPDSPSPVPQVESRIGGDGDLRGLIADAHGATSANGDGIKVLFDYVMKHVDVESGLYQAHWDWFNRGSDNQFVLCGPGNLWEDPYWGTRCAFTSYLAPLDMYNDSTRAWSVNDALWWAKEYGIDGYRLDAIKHVPLSWLTDLRGRLSSEFTAPSGGRFWLVGETFNYYDRDLLKQFVDPQSMLDGQFDFPFKRELCEGVFNPSGSLQNLASFVAGNDTFYDRGPGRTAVMSTWIGNHDVPRAIHFADWKFGNCTEGSHTGNAWTGDFPQPGNPEPYERLALAFAVLMTSPGVPLIYYGDEIGLAGGGDPGNRQMMPWNDSQLNSYQKALRGKVRTLARLRGQWKALGRGTRQTLSADTDTWVYRMGGCGDGIDDVVIAINRSGSSRDVQLPAGSYHDEIAGVDVSGGGSYTLPARGFAVLTPR